MCLDDDHDGRNDHQLENATESEPAILTLDGVFKATATVENGKVVMGIVPDGEMKVLIKDDSAIQEK